MKIVTIAGDGEDLYGLDKEGALYRLKYGDNGPYWLEIIPTTSNL